MLESIREDDPLGLLIGNGCAVTGKTPGVARVLVVKGQSLSAYDPRVLKGTGVTYATVPMGPTTRAATCGTSRTTIWTRCFRDVVGHVVHRALPRPRAGSVNAEREHVS